jgi:hypothetical protein
LKWTKNDISKLIFELHLQDLNSINASIPIYLGLPTNLQVTTIAR